MGTDNPIEATRITFTIKGCIARSTFLAGFTYKELGRSDSQQDDSLLKKYLCDISASEQIFTPSTRSLAIFLKRTHLYEYKDAVQTTGHTN